MTVKKGDPLVELFSTDLAAAKNDYQTREVQWKHDQRILGTAPKTLRGKGHLRAALGR